MQTRDFCFWLQGFFELTNTDSGVTPEQAELIKAHLDLVFKHDVQIKRKEMEHPAPAPSVAPIDWQRQINTGTKFNPSLITATC